MTQEPKGSEEKEDSSVTSEAEVPQAVKAEGEVEALSLQDNPSKDAEENPGEETSGPNEPKDPAPLSEETDNIAEVKVESTEEAVLESADNNEKNELLETSEEKMTQEDTSEQSDGQAVSVAPEDSADESAIEAKTDEAAQEAIEAEAPTASEDAEKHVAQESAQESEEVAEQALSTEAENSEKAEEPPSIAAQEADVSESSASEESDTTEASNTDTSDEVGEIAAQSQEVSEPEERSESVQEASVEPPQEEAEPNTPEESVAAESVAVEDTSEPEDVSQAATELQGSDKAQEESPVEDAPKMNAEVSLQEPVEAKEDAVAVEAEQEAVEPEAEEAPIEAASIEEPKNGSEDSESEVPEEAEEGPFSDAWKTELAEKERVSKHDAHELFLLGGSIESKRLAFIKLDSQVIEEELVVENCFVTGLLLRGMTFQKPVTFRNCYFAERVQFDQVRATEGGENLRCTFHEKVLFESCFFRDVVSFMRSNFHQDFDFVDCSASKEVRLDKSYFFEHVGFKGPGEWDSCSFFRANITKGLHFRDMTFRAESGTALDCKDLKTGDGIHLQDCHTDGSIKMIRGKIGQEAHKAWRAERCSFGKLILREATFGGDVVFEEVKCKGIDAKPPRETHGQRKGRVTTFEGDLSMTACELDGKSFFNNARFQNYVSFKLCHFHGEANFNHAIFLMPVSFWKSDSNKPMHFRKAHFHERANFGNMHFGAKSSFNEAIFEKEAIFFGIQVEGDIFLTSAIFNEELKFNRVEVKGGLGMQKLSVKGDLNMTLSEVYDRLILTEAEIGGDFTAPRLKVGTWASLADSVVSGELILRGMRVGTRLNEQEKASVSTKVQENAAASTEEVEGTSNGSGKKKQASKKAKKKEEFIPGSFYIDNATFRKKAHFGDLKVEGELTLKGTEVGRELDLTRLFVGSNCYLSHGTFRGVFDCSGAKIRGRLSANKARFKEEALFFECMTHKINLNACAFEQGVSLRKAKIEDSLSMNGASVNGKADLLKCSFKRIFFYRLIVDHFLIDRSELGEILSSEEIGNYEQARHEYGILKQAFLQRSLYRDMDWAYYRFCRANRKLKEVSLLAPVRSLSVFSDWLLLDLGFGYGTRPMNIAVMALMVILAFSGIYYAVPISIQDSAGYPMLNLSLLDAVYMSLITFASMDYSSWGPNVDHWLRFVFASEGFLGIFLVTLFVATISRKIIRT